ncbi:MAG: hypothetical protein OXT67_13440 [Zetaproteobacteria bacterium]|nr:hypothetical protein [Zetaproteobacteria bacterium]
MILGGPVGASEVLLNCTELVYLGPASLHQGVWKIKTQTVLDLNRFTQPERESRLAVLLVKLPKGKKTDSVHDFEKIFTDQLKRTHTSGLFAMTAKVARFETFEPTQTCSCKTTFTGDSSCCQGGSSCKYQAPWNCVEDGNAETACKEIEEEKDNPCTHDLYPSLKK